MTTVIIWLEGLLAAIPLPLLEVWGRFAYIVGLCLAICAFGGFTFRIGKRWGFGRARQVWDTKAFLTMPLTFVLVIATGFLGSFIVLVPGAQTFESLKDLAVLLCIVLFGYPALIAVPPAYMLSDLIEGVPPDFVLNWAEGYFFWTAFVWMAYQLIGEDPDFHRARTWRRYGVFVALIMFFDPVMWGYICSEKFTSAISYRNISSALAFTLIITWFLAPAALLVALPLARRLGWFWADIPGRVREHAIRNKASVWESGRSEATKDAEPVHEGLPVRIFIFTPFIALVLLMVGATAVVALRSADDDAIVLATRLHEAVSANIGARLNDFLERSTSQYDETWRKEALDSLLRNQAFGNTGRAFILNRSGAIIASSAPNGDAVVKRAVAALARHSSSSNLSAGSTEFQFVYVSAKPLRRETWLTHVTTYRDDNAGRYWTLVMAMPEAFYLAGLRIASSRSAMVFAVALVLSLVLAAALALMVTAPLRHMAQATRDMARGNLGVRVQGSKLMELDTLAKSFNDMAARLKTSFDDLIGEVETRKLRERELEESGARLSVSEGRLQLAINAAELGIWDWDVERDQLVWDESMYRLYGVRKGDFSGAFAAWQQCLVPEDLPRVNADVEAALRGEREFSSEFRVRRADGVVRIIRGVGQTIRNAASRPVRMVGINRDVTDLINAERERERLIQELQRSTTYLTEAEKLSQTGCWARNIKTDEQFWSAGQWRIFGLEPGAMPPTYRQFLELVHPDDRASVAEDGARAIREKKPYHSSFRILLGGSAVRNFHSVGIPVLQESGDVVEYIGATIDETDRVRAAAAAQEAQSEMARVARLTTMGELAASIAHEINQPLAAITTSGSAALRWMARKPPNLEETKDALKSIVRECNRAAEVIGRIRTFLKNRKPEYAALDINEPIREVLTLTSSALRNRSVTVRAVLPAAIPLVMGDRIQLQQVIMNLVMNGADAMSSVVDRPRILDIQTRVDGAGAVLVTVGDSGTGIDEAIRDRIFDPLFTTKSTGMGMGLSICRSIVETHGGRLWASPSTRGGTDFQFTVPTADSSAKPT